MTEAVVFDLDGTLVDLPINYEKLFEEFGRIMRTENVQPVTKTVARLDERTKKEVFEAWERAELAVLKNATIKTEGMALYRQFSPKPKALVTMQGKQALKGILEPLGLSFKFVITREENLDRTRQLRIAVEKLGAEPRNVLFIGNTEGDALAAREVKCQFMRVGK